MQAPMGKSFKTQGLSQIGVANSSRIRELRENLSWILEGNALPLVPFQLFRPNDGPSILREHGESILEGICWNKLERH